MERYIGKVLNDRYMITEVIGVGGMAYVYKAFDKICNRVVAVKILKDEFMSDTQFRRRFTNESKAITMLSQGNIVDVYDVSLEGDALYIVMEYIDGITLKEYMEKKGMLSGTEALHFIKQILKALAHAHERGIVHRDIKPHNIMLLKDGSIKITDFGIARLTKFDTQTISDMTIGSVHYISPEQASGDRTDARSDLYSVGIILYEMLTAKLPFEADTAVAVALKQVQDQPELPSEICEDLPRGLEDITLKAMMKDPAIRYQSAGAFLADISMFEEDPTIVFNYSAEPTMEIPAVTNDNSPTITTPILKEEPIEEEDLEEEELAEDEETGSSFKKTWLPVLAGIATAFVLLLLVGLGIIFQKELFGTNTVDCPNVVGLTLEQAKSQHNFEFVVESTISSDEHQVGEIISQKPVANTQVKKKSKITLVICGTSTLLPEDDNNEITNNGGDAVNYVPDVLKMGKTAAIDEFERQGIAYKIVSRPSSDVDLGCVITTYPSAGQEVFEDTIVTIYISSGPSEEENDVDEVKTIKMPDLSSLTLDAAKTTLLNNKLVIGTVTEENSETVEAGKVIRQSVLKDMSVEEGTSVDLVISSGPLVDEPSVDTPDGSNDAPNNDGSGEVVAPVLKDVSVPVDLSGYVDPNNAEKQVTVVATAADGTSLYTQTVKPAETPQLLINLTQQAVDAIINISIDGVPATPFTVS